MTLTSALPIPTEHSECVSLMQWAATQRHNGIKLSRLLIHVPNGAYFGADRKTAAIVGKKLLAAGMQPGCFDYILPVPLAICPGLWLEMKRIKGGVTSDDQHEFRELMVMLGWRTAIARGWSDAKAVVERYLAEAARCAMIKNSTGKGTTNA